MADGQSTVESRLGRPRRQLFGDGVGEAVFLGSLLVTWFTWQVGFFITDTYTIANTVVNVAAGHLTIEHLQYSLTLNAQPGLHVVDGALYGRNYGEAFLALPLYYGLELVSAVVDTRLIVPGLWSLVAIAFTRRVGAISGDRRIATGGALAALGLFLANVALARRFADEVTGILALQLLTTIAVAVTALLLYRLLARSYERRVAATVGAASVLATPLWFWAPIPKRHVLTGAAVTLLLFVFAVSRDHESVRTRTALRGLGYVACGYITWVHAFEGIVLLVVFLVMDVVTARSNGWRELAALGLVVVLAFGPFVATNLAIAGSPVESPRMTPSFDPDSNQNVRLGPTGEVITQAEMAEKKPNQGDPGKSSDSTESSGSDSQSKDDPASGEQSGKADDGAGERFKIGNVFGSAIREGESLLQKTASAASDAPSRLFHTYVRSGNIESLRYEVNEQEPVDLTLLESMPLVGTLLVAVGLGLGRVRRRMTVRRPLQNGVRTVKRAISRPLTGIRRTRERARAADSEATTPVFAVGIVLAFGTMYLSFLPLHSQITVRYILPMMPALTYLVGRSVPVRRTIRGGFRPLVGSYVALVATGLGVVVIGFPALELAIGEAMQLHALVNIGTALVAIALIAGREFGVGVSDRLAAAGLALPLATTTVLLVAMQLAYFTYGTRALPVARVVAELFGVLS